MKRIGFFSPSKGLDVGGIAPYSERLWSTLHRYNFNSSIQLDLITEDIENQSVTSTQRIIRRLLDSLRVLALPGSPEDRLRRRSSIHRRLLKEYDLMHVPFQVPPVFDIPYICTMHDVQDLHFPEFFTPLEREMRAKEYRLSLANAERVVVSFDHVKCDLIRYFKMPDEKVVVIPVPFSECELKAADEFKKQEYKRKYSDVEMYFLYPAKTWPHKNHLGLIDAFERIQDRLPKAQLLFTGKLDEYYSSTLKKRVEKSPAGHRIQFLGVIPEEELRWLYENTACVVIPTLYEAGSFPLLEAMSLEVPVICAQTTSLPVTIDDRQFTFNPTDAGSMADLMVTMVENSEFRTTNIENSKNRISYFHTENIAAQYESLWEATIAGM